jgi:hypothetical protein
VTDKLTDPTQEQAKYHGVVTTLKTHRFDHATKSVTFEPVTKCQLQLQAKLPTKLPKSLSWVALNFCGVSVQQPVNAGGGSKAEEPPLQTKKKRKKKKKWPVDAQTCNRSHRKTSNLNKVKLGHGVQQQHIHTCMHTFDAVWMV